ncbi:MAG: DUF2064 domain-containing protein [Akkermansiaceae bacterium]|nr:DUF2064 domain-containing protein [Akkermansiaceae bacterium]
MRLLLVFIEEPTPGEVLPELAAEVGAEKACHYYKAMVEVMLKQLQGLEKCRIRFCYSPHGASDATRFWLLPQMAATTCETEHLYITSNPSSPELQIQEIDFRAQGGGSMAQRLKRAFSAGFSDGYQEIAIVDPTCIECGARWINASFARFHSETSRDTLIGATDRGDHYILALKSEAPDLFEEADGQSKTRLIISESKAQQLGREVEHLPPLSVTTCLDDWHRLLDSPLGPALKKALGEPLEDTDA